MDYYKGKMRAYRYIQSALTLAKQQDKVLSKNALILDITNQFPTSELAIQKRLEMYEQQGFILLKGDEITVLSEPN